MEGEEIGFVLARASDLHSRISACAAAARPPSRRNTEEAVKRLGAAEDEEGDEEEESLVGISDALESLERQLAALQVTCGWVTVYMATCSAALFPVWFWQGSCCFLLTVSFWRANKYIGCYLLLKDSGLLYIYIYIGIRGVRSAVQR
jgi:hypothetical protein